MYRVGTDHSVIERLAGFAYGRPMVDFEAIADEVRREAQTFAGVSHFSDAPDLSEEGKFARFCAAAPFPPEHELAVVLREAFWASLLTEEGRQCRPRLMYSPTQPIDEAPVVSLVKPVSLDRANLRKMTPAHGETGYATWRFFSDDLPMITGIRSHGAHDAFTVVCKGVGALDVLWQGFRMLTLRGDLTATLSKSQLPKHADALTYLANRVFKASDVAHALLTIEGVARLGHGGSVWIVREGTDLGGLKVGHELVKSVPLLERFGDDKSSDERFKRSASYAHLAAVDGALLIDSRCRPLGFGVFSSSVDGGMREPVTRLMPNGGSQPITSDRLGGGRHRSAVDFCRQFSPCAAFVVSQDGRITLVVGEEAGVWCAEIVSLGVTLGPA